MRRTRAFAILPVLSTAWLFTWLFVPVARASAGDLDPTFHGDGKLLADVRRGSENAGAVAVQSDGKIVVTIAQGGDFVVLRYDMGGALDASFDGDGMVVTDFGEPFEDANAIAIQRDGKIVVGGSAGCGSFALARYNIDGSLDPSFDGDGKVLTDFGGCDIINALAIQADGKIVASGETFSPFAYDFAIARYNPDGGLDTGFGSGGKVTTDFGGYDAANAAALQPDGRIVVVGNGGANAFLVARYRTAGSLDPTFDGDGKRTVDFNGYGWASDVAIQSDDKIVVSGFGTFSFLFALARLNGDGSLDASFDGDGKVTANPGGDTRKTAVALQADGSIVLAGTIYHDFDASFAIVRFDSHGTLDPSFGSGGRVVTDFGNPQDVGGLCPAARSDCSEDIVSDMTIQRDGKIIVVGGAGPCTPTCFTVLARYEAGPPPDKQPPTLTVSADPSVIWPPNHHFVPVHVAVTVFDDVDPAPTVELVSATSDEPSAGRGAGQPSNDIRVVSDTEFMLRAERQGAGSGREYRLCYRATDHAGNATDTCCTVRVPHDRSGRAELAADKSDLVIFGSSDMAARRIASGSVRLLLEDSTVAMHGAVAYQDRDQDSFEDAVFVRSAVEGSTAIPRGSAPAPRGQYARWEVHGAGYLAMLAAPVTLGVGPAGPREKPTALVIPNPVSDEVMIQYVLPRASRVRLAIFDVSGREKARLVDGIEPRGAHEMRWTPAEEGGAQAYWYRLEAMGQTVTGRFVVRK